MTEAAKDKLVATIADVAWAGGEAGAFRAVSRSDLHPFFKWNLMFVLGFNTLTSAVKAQKSIEGLFTELKGEKTSTVEVPESEES